MGTRANKAKQRAMISFDMGVDDLSSVLTWKDRWEKYNEAAIEAQEKAKKKGGILGFIRTAVFALTAYLSAGMITIASAATSFFASAGAGMIADEIIGEYNLEKPTAKPVRKYKRSGEVQQIANYEEAYDTLQHQIDSIEQDFNQGHWKQPLQLVATFYGQDIMKGIKNGTLFDTPSVTAGLDTGSIAGSGTPTTIDASGNVVPGTSYEFGGFEYGITQPPSVLEGATSAAGTGVEAIAGANLFTEALTQTWDLVKNEALVTLAEGGWQSLTGEGAFSKGIEGEESIIEDRNKWNQGFDDALNEVIDDVNLA
tara:strand:- start:191 stop:1126 length:936 start_codon:yes stop_codon:yes gene_type:complete